MATRFSVPASPKRSVLEIDNFLGVDLTNTGSNISENRSPNAPNMIRDVPGKVRKRMGYETKHIFTEGKVYGAHVLKSQGNTNVYKQNLCKSKVITEKDLVKDGTFYIYSEDDIPVGSKIHIQFSYTSSGAVELSPYIEDYEWVRIDAIGKDTQFYANFDIAETTNAFVFKNVSNNTINITLNDVMIYFVTQEENYNLNYSSYMEIPELRFYKLGGDNTSPGTSGTVTKTTPLKVAINENEDTGIQFISTHIDLSNLSGGTLSNLTVTFEGIRYELGDTTPLTTELYPARVYTSYASGGYDISCVVDPAENHEKYDITRSYISGVNIQLEGSTTSFSATVAVGDIHYSTAELKKDLDENDYIRLVHVGNCMYQEINGVYTLLSDDMNSDYSKSWQTENKLYIIDGRSFHVYNRDDHSYHNVSTSIPTSDNNAENIAYVPTLTIAKSPTGGGTAYEDLNLLTPAFIELFGGTETAKQFQLSFNSLDATTVKAWVMDANGVFREKKEGTDFTVDRSKGTVIFSAAPGNSPLAGEDNVKILAYKTNLGYADRINNCTVGALFGVNGAADRLFLSGNKNYINYDWHSDQYKYNYFPDTGYAKLGSDSSAIMGYSIVNNYLAAHKDEDDSTQAVIIREGDLLTVGETTTSEGGTIYDQEPSFRIINTLQGAGVICKNSFATLQTEPVFLTRSGVFAITPQDMTGEKYAQNRSFYINGQLLEEKNLENAFALVYNDMYLLFINTKVYVLDGLQETRTDRSEPYSSRQYAAFVLNNIPATVAWIEDEKLWFGTSDGKICQFYTDKEALESYSDDGQPIEAWWETPDLDGNLFYKKKTFRYIAARVKSSILTHVTIYARQRGIWTLIKTSKDLSNRVFSFSTLVFSEFTFNNDTSDPVVSSKLRVKKVDKARFKLENSRLNEPFGLQNLAFEYVESGNYKG